MMLTTLASPPTRNDISDKVNNYQVFVNVRACSKLGNKSVSPIRSCCWISAFKAGTATAAAAAAAATTKKTTHVEDDEEFFLVVDGSSEMPFFRRV